MKIFTETVRIIYLEEKKYSLLFLMISILKGSILPFQLLMVQNFIDYLIIKDSEWFVYFTILLISFLFLGCLEGYSYKTENLFKQSIELTIQKKILNKQAKLEYKYLEGQSYNDIIKHIRSDLSEQFVAVFNYFLQVTSILVAIIGTSFILAQISYMIPISLLLILVPTVLFAIKGTKLLFDMYYYQNKDERILNKLEDLFSEKASLQDIKLYESANFIKHKINKISNKIQKEQYKKIIKSDLIYNVSTLLILLWTVIILFIISNFNNVTLGILMSVIQAVFRIVNQVESLSDNYTNMTQGLSELRYYFLYQELSEEKNLKLNKINTNKWSLTFNEVSFKYPDTNKLVLDKISFEIKQGEKVALVGENGSGKTTLLKLICKLYNTTSGVIKINGEHIEKSGIHDFLYVIFQNHYNFWITLGENLYLHSLTGNYNEDHVERLKENLIVFQDNKLNTKLGKLDNNSVELSGGQWQQVAIGRGILPNNDLLILDEPNSSIDPQMERKFQQLLEQLLEKESYILVSHRLSTAISADRIIVLKEGKIIEEGNHHQLIASRGHYYELFKAQADWYREAKIDEE
ncbi:ABC transporter ATP-binding protein [Listeria welshimeri]|nr:ABC transporter ATP-binding protein [Listeria welshimeri]